MVDVRKLIQGRKKVLETLKTQIRTFDASVEIVRREVVRLLARKKAVPDDQDLARLVRMFRDISEAMVPALKTLQAGYPQ